MIKWLAISSLPWPFMSFCFSLSARPQNRSIPMWLSSPRGTVQVSRLGWRIPTPSVTNAFGWSAGPRGALFCSSVGTWQQSPQELFKWDKLFQSQEMLLHSNPSPLDHTFKTGRSRFFPLSSSSCFLWAFQCKWSQASSQIWKNKKKTQKYLSIWETKMKTLAWSIVKNQVCCRIESVCHSAYRTWSLLSEAKQQQTTLCLWIGNEEGRGTRLHSAAMQEFNVPVLITVRAIVARTKKKNCKPPVVIQSHHTPLWQVSWCLHNSNKWKL